MNKTNLIVPLLLVLFSTQLLSAQTQSVQMKDFTGIKFGSKKADVVRILEKRNEEKSKPCKNAKIDEETGIPEKICYTDHFEVRDGYIFLPVFKVPQLPSSNSVTLYFVDDKFIAAEVVFLSSSNVAFIFEQYDKYKQKLNTIFYKTNDEKNVFQPPYAATDPAEKRGEALKAGKARIATRWIFNQGNVDEIIGDLYIAKYKDEYLRIVLDFVPKKNIK